MPDSFSMTLEGAKELDRKLNQLGAKVAKKHLVKALRAGGKLILAATRAMAPVDTGRLKRSLVLRAGKSRRSQHEKTVTVQPSSKKEPGLISYKLGSASVLGAGRGGRAKLSGRRYFYPAVVEYGTAKRAGKPFMRPAFDSQGRPAVNAIMRSLRDAVEKEGAKK